MSRRNFCLKRRCLGLIFLELLILLINFVLEFLDLPLARLQLLLNLGKVRLEFLLVADVAGLSLHGRDLLLFLLGQGLLLHHFELLFKGS
jgi:hypothetical protein